MWRYALPLALFALLAVALRIGLERDPTVVPSPLIGRPAPEFSLPSLQDVNYPIATSDLRGQPWLLNVWATWCVGCRQEHEVLLQIAAQNVVPMIGLNWKDDNAGARRWLAELGNPYGAVAEDRDGRVAIDWGVYGAPETFLIGPDGIVLHKHIAPMTMEIWRTEFLPRIESARRTGGQTS